MTKKELNEIFSYDGLMNVAVAMYEQAAEDVRKGLEQTYVILKHDVSLDDPIPEFIDLDCIDRNKVLKYLDAVRLFEEDPYNMLNDHGEEILARIKAQVPVITDKVELTKYKDKLKEERKKKKSKKK